MEKEEKKIKLHYIERVDTTFIAFRKELINCIGVVTDIIKVQCALGQNTDFLQSLFLTLSFLNTNLNNVDNFLSEYTKLEEVV